MTTLPILVVFALPEESTDFLRLLRPVEVRGRGHLKLARGLVADRPVVVAHTGMGAAAAALTMPHLLREWRPGLVIGSGFAGGLQPQVPHGAVVCDVREHYGFALPRGVLAGAVRAAPVALETAAAKAAFGQQTGALAVDMESTAAAVATAAAEVPYIVLRGISDEVNTALPVPTDIWFDLERQRPRIASLLGYLLRHPSRLAPFVRFVTGLSAPRAALAEALMELLASPLPTLRR